MSDPGQSVRSAPWRRATSASQARAVIATMMTTELGLPGVNSFFLQKKRQWFHMLRKADLFSLVLNELFICVVSHAITNPLFLF